MVSSEVQRTLVKSPPELWAELSDPDSLARHLGELGEIAITRSEPEKLVEWEAAGITGTVAIKPSGWGTRVTLTVERELPEGSVETEGDAPPSSEAEDVPVAEPEIPPSPTGEARPEEPRPAPATEAARRAAGWPGPDATGPAIESALRAAEDGAGEVATVPAVWPSASSEAEAAEEATVTPTPEIDAEPEARRGFFARLFGGRRRRAAEQAQTEALPGTAAKSEEEPRTAPPEATAEPRPDYLPAALEEALPVIVVAEHEPTVVESEEAQAVEAAAPLSEDPPPAELEARAAEELAEATEDVGEATEAVAEATEDVAEATEAGAGPDEDAASGRPSAKDIAAELKSAEESAAAEVTAILTGVLDRLGAAHHRPFSRA